jgi:hypothetical protein
VRGRSERYRRRTAGGRQQLGRSEGERLIDSGVSWPAAGGVEGALPPDGDDAFESEEQDVAAIVIRIIPQVAIALG